MSSHTISIPDSLYEKARRVAQEVSQTVDDVIRARLEVALVEPTLDIPADEQAELRAMAYLSDDTLWTIAREQLQPTLEKRLSELLTSNQQGTISDAERAELEDLVERGDKLMLRKARAMKHLSVRGHKIEPSSF